MCPAISSAVTTRERRTKSRTTCPSRRCLAGQKTTPECFAPLFASEMKSLPHVTKTRPCARANANCCPSERPSNPCSRVAVTSTPRNLRPAAMAESMCSSRWNLISTRRSLHSIGLAAAAGQKPLNGLCLQPRHQCVIVSNILVDQASVVVVIRQGRIDICERQMRKRTHDLVGRPPLLGPENNVLNSNSRSRNSWLSPARARG